MLSDNSSENTHHSALNFECNPSNTEDMVVPSSYLCHSRAFSHQTTFLIFVSAECNFASVVEQLMPEQSSQPDGNRR